MNKGLFYIRESDVKIFSIVLQGASQSHLYEKKGPAYHARFDSLSFVWGGKWPSGLSKIGNARVALRTYLIIYHSTTRHANVQLLLGGLERSGVLDIHVAVWLAQIFGEVGCICLSHCQRRLAELRKERAGKQCILTRS